MLRRRPRKGRRQRDPAFFVGYSLNVDLTRVLVHDVIVNPLPRTPAGAAPPEKLLHADKLLHGRERRIEWAAADACAWGHVQSRLIARPELRPLLPMLETFSRGFAVFMCQLNDRRLPTLMTARRELHAASISERDCEGFFAILQQTAWSVEADWMAWLQAKGTELRGGVLKALRGLPAKVLPAAVSIEYRQRTRVESQRADAARSCVRALQRSDPRNEAIVRLVDFLRARGVTAYRAHRVLGALLGLRADQVRLRYTYYAKGRTPRPHTEKPGPVSSL